MLELTQIGYQHAEQSYLRTEFMQEPAGKPARESTTSAAFRASARTEYVEISMEFHRARSLCRDLLSLLTSRYQASPGAGTQEGLRSFYAAAREALDQAFLQAAGSSDADPETLEALHRQAAKELQDWYHNGGEPREKVNFASVNITRVSLQEEVASCLNASLEKPSREAPAF